jgi:ABC-type glycerol-3-phosphate transport system substrate-binding protein
MKLAIATLLVSLMCLAAACGGPARVLTISGSMLGREGEVLALQIERFRQAHPDLPVTIRATPDAADQRHQLYVQWLNAHVGEPDVLQLDVVWTPEFAAAGWIRSLDEFQPPLGDLFASAVAANRWRGKLYALPWFIDVGMLYWRSDLMPAPPDTIESLAQLSRTLIAEKRVPFGVVWQGARYEGVVTVFLEHLGAFGGAILDGEGRVVVDDEAAVRALTFMRDSIHVDGFVPSAVLTWQEEHARFAFQNGQAAFMRNWPYAYALLDEDDESHVASRFAVAPWPGASGGRPTAALGGSTLAINAYSDQPDDAYRLIDFLLRPQQMMERARVAGQYPPARALYDRADLEEALRVPTAQVRRIIETAVPRPVTPVYSQLSSILQVSVHRALTRQQEPRAALAEAAAAMRELLARLQIQP